jgi:iron complex outermembrane recepter protein
MRFIGLLVGIVGVVVAGLGPAPAQTIQLPQITVNAPSPIARRTPAPPDTAPSLQGTLPIVTDQFATVTVVPAEELQRSTGSTLGDVLQSKPGITSSSFAPGAASRPIVRGLDNYRVRIQENGLATNDVSEIGEDHGVALDPLAARQIEVIRGPATLRFGSQAIGGVVNVDNNRIPTSIPLRGFAGEVKGALNSADIGRDGAILLEAGQGNFAFHADAFGAAPTTTASPATPICFRRIPRPWSAAGSRTRRCVPTASRSAARTFSTAALSASRCRASQASIMFPASRRPRPEPASISTRPR